MIRQKTITSPSTEGEASSIAIPTIQSSDASASAVFAPSSSFALLICLVAANFFRVGCQLVLTAWSAVQITGRPDSVGHVLLISSATNFALSPFIGAFVDRCSHKKPLILLGHCGVAICGVSPHALALFLPRATPFSALVITALLSSISGILLTCAMDYFVKHAIASNERTRKLALVNTISQFTLIVGTGFGGSLVALAPWRDAFLLIAACGIGLATVCACRLPSLTYEPRTRQGLYRAGPALYLQHHRLFAIASCSALAFAVGQVTNTLLPAFLNLDLKFSSERYAFVEAAWCLGALAASAALTKVAKDRLPPLHRDLFIVFVIAGLLFFVPRLSALTALLAVHLALGIGFAIVRVRTEARFITECPTHLLARFRANSLFLSSALSAIVFITPTVYRNVGVPALYQLLSAAIALSALVLFGFTRPWRAEPSSLSSR